MIQSIQVSQNSMLHPCRRFGAIGRRTVLSYSSSTIHTITTWDNEVLPLPYSDNSETLLLINDTSKLRRTFLYSGGPQPEASRADSFYCIVDSEDPHGHIQDHITSYGRGIAGARDTLMKLSICSTADTPGYLRGRRATHYLSSQVIAAILSERQFNCRYRLS
jgi:hypothetical protein